MKISKLVQELKQFDVNYPVFTRYFGEDIAIGEIDSYRGYYDQLSLVPQPHSILTVGMLISMLEEAAKGQKEFTGYKGGSYTYSEYTPVWVSKYGLASELKITGLTYRDGKVWVNTFEDDYYN